jgi:hypothetical protein
LIALIVPSNVIEASAVPSPEQAPQAKLRPAVLERVSVPFVAVRETRTAAAPASGSAIEIWLAPPKENVLDASSFVVCAPGTVLTGGWLTAAALKVTVKVALEPRTALHGFVVPEHVDGLRSA